MDVKELFSPQESVHSGKPIWAYLALRQRR